MAPRPKPKIRPAVAGDAPALAELGATTFVETFADGTAPDDLAAFVRDTYSPERQRAELGDPGVYIAVATLGVEDALGGFVMLRRGEAPACVAGPAPIELARLYVRSAALGEGIGHALLDHVRAVARGRGFRTLWLGVWEHNARAMAFYERHNFRDVGSHIFVVGTDRQTDRLMEAPL